KYDLIDFVKLYSEDGERGYGLHPISLPAPEEERLVTSWYYTGQNKSGTIDETIIPPDVPPGLYVLNIKHEGRSYSQLFVILSSNTIVAKRSGDELFVWVSNINGESIPDAEVRLYSDNGEKIREGKTDQQGIYRVTVPMGYNPMLVSAKAPDKREADVTITGLAPNWASQRGWYWQPKESADYLVYTYSDRPIYRPGQTVNFKSILRDDHDVKYSLLPVDTQVTVNVRDPKNNLLQSTQTQLSQFGSLNGSFAIAEGATLGEYEIEILANGESNQQIFKVEDYRKPDFKVILTPSDPDQGNQFIAGQQVDLDIDVHYFFEEPVAGAKLTYTYYELFPSYDWWNPNPEEVSYRWMQTSSNVRKIAPKTEEDGTAQITLKATSDSEAFKYSSFYDWRSSLRTKTFAVEVTADDGSNQPVSGTYIYKVTNANEKLSLDTQGYFKRPNTPFTVQASVKDLFDKPVAARQMTLEVKKWTNTNYELVGKSYPLTSDDHGVATQELTLEPGYYELALSGQDSLGNSVSYTHWVGVFIKGGDWHERRNSEIEISAEKETYKPYETARFMIESGFSGPALLTFERGSVVHTKQVLLTAPITVVEAQIIPEDAPNIFVIINAWEPTKRLDTQGEYVYYSNIPDSHLRMASTELLVEADTKSLDIAINTDKPIYEPREQITVNIDVKNSKDQPVEAEVSLALVDEAIFSLSNELTKPIFQAFYGPRSLSVDTYDSMRPYREMMAGGMGGGGDAMVAAPRRDFPDTAAWYPTLVTDENGHASITFNLPDNLTSWRLSAKAITLNHQVGEARANIETKKDLMLRPFLPRVLTTGDQTELSVMVHNYSSEERTVKVTIQAQHLQIQDEVTQSVTIPASGSRLVGWSIVPTGTTEIPLTFSAVADNQSQDSIQLPLPVQPLAVADVQSVSGTFNESISLNLVRPTDAL
ncbi:MAG TPA: MG2 domain-containing protein, partial [Anaerolineales bacterium]